MIEKKIESWIFWIIIDTVAAYLYFAKDIMIYGVEYVAFCVIAAWGLYYWIVEYKSYKTEVA
jgi:nicotinamide mononucleotide transporter